MIGSLLARLRRNHALEHATINLASELYPKSQLVGLSGPWGFTLYTNLTAEEIVPTAMQALKRLQAGDHELSVHANCGTNLIVTATLTTLATLFGWREASDVPFRRRAERLPQVVLLNVFALILARPLGRWVQANITTDPDLANVEIASIFTDFQGSLRRIRVNTRQR